MNGVAPLLEFGIDIPLIAIAPLLEFGIDIPLATTVIPVGAFCSLLAMERYYGNIKL